MRFLLTRLRVWLIRSRVTRNVLYRVDGALGRLPVIR